MKARFFIDIETEQNLNNEIQMELLVDIRNAVKSLRYRFPNADIRVTRQVSNDDIMEAIHELQSEKRVEDCVYFDEAQGRGYCVNKNVKSKKCEGICKFYWDKKNLTGNQDEK